MLFQTLSFNPTNTNYQESELKDTLLEQETQNRPRTKNTGE